MGEGQRMVSIGHCRKDRRKSLDSLHAALGCVSLASKGKQRRRGKKSIKWKINISSQYFIPNSFFFTISIVFHFFSVSVYYLLIELK